MVEVGKVILWVSMLSEPLELARLTRTAPDVLVCIDGTKDFSCDLSCHVSLEPLDVPTRWYEPWW